MADRLEDRGFVVDQAMGRSDPDSFGARSAGSFGTVAR